MVFCNAGDFISYEAFKKGHNPYFSRWFSAIKKLHMESMDKNGHNPYFSRWFSAINLKIKE